MNEWTRPSFVEVAMNAEIGAYYDVLANEEVRAPEDPIAAAPDPERPASGTGEP